MDLVVLKIYETLHESYPISLNSSLAISPNFKTDFPILCGTSQLGKFEVFFDDVSFPFYVMRDNGEVFAHWHLQTPDEVEKTVVDFMEGKPSVILFGQPNNT